MGFLDKPVSLRPIAITGRIETQVMAQPAVLRVQTRTWAVCALGLTVVVLVVVAVVFGQSMLAHGCYDDAYITFRYARNLALGHGVVYNPGERTDSASSLLWTILLAAAYRVGLHDLPSVASLGDLVAALITGAITLRLGRAFALPAILVTPVLAIAVVSAPWLAWAVSGMETSVFALLCYATLLAYMWETREYRTPLLSSILGSLALLSRYEAVLLPIAIVVVDTIGLVANNQQRRHRIISTVMRIGVWTLTLIVFLAWKLVYYGSVIPHAVAFKAVEPYYRQAPDTLGFFIRDFPILVLGTLGVLVSIPLIRQARHRTQFIVGSACIQSWLALGLWLILSYVVVEHSPYADLNRYAIHLLPGLALIATGGIYALWIATRSQTAVLQLLIGGMTLLVLMAQGSASASAARSIGAVWSLTRNVQDQREAVGQWLKAHTNPSSLILSGDAGAIGWYSGRPILDGVGLLSPDAQQAKVTHSGAALLKRVRPSYIADTAYTVYPNATIRRNRPRTQGEIDLGVDVFALRSITQVRALVDDVSRDDHHIVVWHLTWHSS